jgi:Tfp pilus assembly pilus retraction ATPase PilT
MSTDPTSPVSTATTSTYVPRRIDEYLKEVLSRSGSDLHFIANDPPRIRLYGELQPLRQEILSPQFVEETLREIMPRAAQQRLEEKNGADFAYIPACCLPCSFQYAIRTSKVHLCMSLRATCTALSCSAFCRSLPLQTRVCLFPE